MTFLRPLDWRRATPAASLFWIICLASSAQAQELAISKTHTGNFVQGGTGTYTVTVRNIGTSAFPAGPLVRVAENLPTGMTITAMSGLGWSCFLTSSPPDCGRTDGLSAGTSYPPITVTVSIAATASSPLVNGATVSRDGASATASDSTVIVPPATWQLTKTHSGNFMQGLPGTYTITARNSGSTAISGGLVTVTDNVPTGMTIRSMAGTGWSCSVGLTTGTCGRTATLAAQASFPSITLEVDVASTAAASLVNVATLSSGSIPNVVASDPTTIVPPGPSLRIIKAHYGNFLQGLAGQYRMLVSNVGRVPTAAAAAVTVVDDPPAGMTITSMSGQGWSCTIPRCTRSDVLGAERAYPPITVIVLAGGASSATSFTNTATVTGGGSASFSATDPTLLEFGQPTAGSTTGSGQSAPLNSIFRTPLQVRLSTPSGAIYSPASLTFTAPASGPSGVWPNGTRTVTVQPDWATGVATAPAFRANGIAGAFSVTVTLAPSGGASLASFPLTNTGAAAPALTGPPFVTFDLASPTSPPVTQTITVDNGTGGPTPVSYRIIFPNASAAGWLTAVPTALTTPAVFKVTANPAGFRPGTYLALLVVSPVVRAAGPQADEVQEPAPAGAVPGATAAKDAYVALLMKLGLPSPGRGPLTITPRCTWLSADSGPPAVATDLEKQLPCTYTPSDNPGAVTLAPTLSAGAPQEFAASLTFPSPDTEWLTARLGANPVPPTPGAGGSTGALTNTQLNVAIQPRLLKRSPETAFVSAVLQQKGGGDVAIVTAAAGSSVSVAPHVVSFDAGAGPPPPQTLTLSSIAGNLNFTAVSNVDWLTVDPPTESANPRTPLTLTLTANPAGLGQGLHPATLTIRKADEPAKEPEIVSVTLNTVPAAAGRPTVTAIEHGASFKPTAIGSGTWVAIKGTALANVAPPGREWRDTDFVGNRLPTSLDGVSVMINNTPAYVQFISQTQINVIVPGSVPDGPVTIVVTNNGRTSTEVSSRIQPLTPAFFQYDKYAVGQRVRPTSAFVGNPSLSSLFQPARPGDVITLWATGLGPTAPATQDGVRPPGGANVATTPLLFLNGRATPILGAAISQFPATYQINFTVPNDLPEGDVLITMSVAGVSSPEGVYFFVGR